MHIVNHTNAALQKINTGIVHILPKIKFGHLEVAIKCLSLSVMNSSDNLQKLVFNIETWN